MIRLFIILYYFIRISGFIIIYTYIIYLLLELANIKTLRYICLQTVISSSASKSAEKCLCHTLVSQAQIIIEPFYYLKYVTYIHKLFYTNLSSLKTMANAQQKENLFYSSIYQMQKQTKAHLKLWPHTNTTSITHKSMFRK